MTNEELVSRIQRGEDRFEELWLQSEQFVKKMANRWTRSAEFDDLVQQGFLILHDAAADYAPEQGGTFIHYLGQRLSWGWSRWIEEAGSVVRLPSYMVQQIRQYNSARQTYVNTHGCEPTEADLSGILGVDLTTLGLIKEAAEKARIRSLNEPIEGMDGSVTELEDLIPDVQNLEEDALERIQNDQLATVIWPMVDSLEEQQAAVIWARYKKNQPVAAIAASMHTTEATVVGIERHGFRELRKPKNRKKLQPYLDVRNAALIGTGLSSFRRTFTSATERTAIRCYLQSRRLHGGDVSE